MNETPDEDFRKPYVDVDEWRDTPVRHRYVHGGFADHGTRFSIYFPPDDAYQGRFFQHITPAPGGEHRAQTARGQEDRISFAVSSGAYFLKTNGGGADPGDPTVAGFRANAAAARHSRVVAQWVYGPHRVHGYAYGSGGGYRTIAGAENTDGVWDGFVPYVIGSPMAIPNVFSVRMHAQRVLRHRLDTIVDALEPRRQQRPVQGPRRRGAGGARRGHGHGLPATRLVRPPHDGHARLHHPLRRHAPAGPRLLRRFLDAARVPRGRSRLLGSPRPPAAHLQDLRRGHSAGRGAARPRHAAGGGRPGRGGRSLPGAGGGGGLRRRPPACGTRPPRRAGHGADRAVRTGRGEVPRPARSAGRPGAAGRAARSVHRYGPAPRGPRGGRQ